MKIVSIFLILSILMFACKPVKKGQKIQDPISKVDTTAVVIIANNKTAGNLDSQKNEVPLTSRDLFEKVIKNNIVFNTFNAKVRVQYEDNEGGDEATAYVRLQKDSVMWLSLRGALGIEGFRVLITKDSVKVMNLLKKNIQYKGINYLREITGMPINFSTLQDIVVGNPVFIDSNIVSHQINANNQLLVLMGGKTFKHLVTLDNSDLKILHSKLDDVDTATNRTCEITFSDYENSAGFPFSKKRKISVAEQSKLNINLDFKQYSFNQPLTFPFNIPGNYKRLN